jgi:carbamoyl-phosphate synthase large subunit
VTRLAVTRRHPAIDQLCRAIQERFRADGPFNVQLRLAPNGTPTAFEINPRFSTTVTLTVAAGVDEVGGLVAAASGTALPTVDHWQDGLALVRSSVDRFVLEAELPRPARPAPTA